MQFENLTSRDWDLVIVGTGPMGAAIAHEVHRTVPQLSILAIEGGRSMSANDGEHLVEADEDALRVSFETLMRRARQIEYVQQASSDLGNDSWTPESVGIFPAAFLGHDFTEFPGASIAWNVGGMGIHWAAACPWPYSCEIPTFVDTTFSQDLREANRLLRVTSHAFRENPFQQPIIDALRNAIPSPDLNRQAQNMPLAGVSRPGGGAFARTGPRDIAPELFDGSVPHVALLTGTLVSRLVHLGRRVAAVVARDVASGSEVEIRATAVVVAADALRSPQLLWASGIRPAALGLYLNEHATIDGEVVLDANKLGVPAGKHPTPEVNEPFVGAYWSPSIGNARPTHGQMMERFNECGHSLGMSWYTATDLRRENRLEFSDDRVDATGMPLITARFAYSHDDLERIEMLRTVQLRAALSLGNFHPGDSEMLAPGSSLHYTGTVRLGDTDDGTSVAAPDGRVWGFENLFVAGNGAIPTALTCNSTLTALALGMRTARAVAQCAGARRRPISTALIQ